MGEEDDLESEEDMAEMGRGTVSSAKPRVVNYLG